MTPEVIEEQPITVYEAKDLLGKSTEEELSFRANKTKEYLDTVPSLKAKDAKAAVKELTELEIPRVKVPHIIKLVDVMPYAEEDVKATLFQFSVTLKSDHIKKILEVLDKYRAE